MFSICIYIHVHTYMQLVYASPTFDDPSPGTLQRCLAAPRLGDEVRCQGVRPKGPVLGFLGVGGGKPEAKGKGLGLGA